MGDIILGALLFILILILLGLYVFRTRKNTNQRSLTGFISFMIVLGSLLGILFTCLNNQLLENHPGAYVIAILFFITQALASILYLKKSKPGLSILIVTLLLQIPIVHSTHYSYRNQTLFSFNVEDGPGKIFDVEPGSYVHYISMSPEKLNKTFTLGINLLPVLIIFIYWRKERNKAT